MEAALSQFTTKIISFVVLMLVSYVVISLTVHKGLKEFITSPTVRDGVVKISSLVAFCLIGMAVLTWK